MIKYSARTIGVVVFSLAVGVAAKQYFSNKNSKDKIRESLAFELSKAADDVNKKLPILVDEVTRLDRVVNDGTALFYRYTILGGKASDSDIKANIEANRAGTVDSICTGPLGMYLAFGASVTHAYVGSSGGKLVEVVVTQKDCVRYRVDEIRAKKN